MNKKDLLNKIVVPADLTSALEKCKTVIVPESKEDLVELCYGSATLSHYEVSYEIPGKGRIVEAEVARCKNGPCVNFMEEYMRRRDPHCMYIGDDLPTDKPTFKDAWGYDFSKLREETTAWLSEQPLVVMPFSIGGKIHGYDSLVVAPANAAFFAYALANIQDFVCFDDTEASYVPRSIIYVAPPFRHTHFGGKQAVVHCRSEQLHEVFSYNLYPGPSAKKGCFSILLDIGEQEGWITNHASAALLITPYENEIVFMHEGASGGGKSEMLEEIHRESDGRVLLGKHSVTGEHFHMSIGETCEIFPIADDMVMAHSDMQDTPNKLTITDAENGWFLRVDGDKYYGNIPKYERASIHPSEPIEFFNIDGKPGATCLIWEHKLESTGKPCSNPRVILPRNMIENIVPGDEGIVVDVRSFGVRMPPSTLDNPNYGVIGMVQIIPPSLAWLWRLVAPRGYKNPSIADKSKHNEMTSEGIGSYWPFATGRKITQANLLLKQICEASETLYILIPNQYIGAYKVGFASEWLTREYLARRGGTVKANHLVKSRCPLFGYALDEMKIDGQYIRQTFLRPELQSRLGEEGYDTGAKIITDFFKEELKQYLVPELDPLGREIIELCLNDAPIEKYVDLTPMYGVRWR